MKLNFRKIGSGHPLIILHGLYGAGDNWLSIGKSLSGICEVYLIDQRNHGSSPHGDEHNYDVLMNDLKEFFEEQSIGKAMILGHSMGGKVAMRFAMEFPGMISKLIVADVSPGPYLDNNNDHVKVHHKIISAMMEVDLSVASGLSDIDNQLAGVLEEERLRKFLLKNIRKDKDQFYQWKLNLPVLKKNLSKIADGLDLERMKVSKFSSFPVLFIRGENSDYIGESDKVLIKRLFSLSSMITLKNAGHWLHAEQAELFTKAVKRFILS